MSNIFRMVAWLFLQPFKKNGVSISKTILLNLRFFPLRQGAKLPVWIYRNTKFRARKGNILFEGPLTTGAIKIGILYSILIITQSLIISEKL